MTSILPEVQALSKELISYRRAIHAHPELRFEEVKTAALVAEELKRFGYEVFTGIGKTGVVGILRGAHPGPCIALRADMDGLPVQEENKDKEYRSQVPNRMHACGHDGHVAMLLVAAKLFVGLKEQLRGSIKLFFQPGEEGGHGALEMIKEGALAIGGLNVDEVYGIHLWNSQKTGYVGLAEGPVMAASGNVTVKVVGKGGHGSMPHDTVDAVAISAQLINAFQTVVSRSVNPLESAVVSIGKIQGGFAPNVIAETVVMEGTIRTYKTDVEILVKKRIKEICHGVATAFGASVEVSFEENGYPATVNSGKETEKMKRSVAKIVKDFGPPYLSMAGEDFSYFLQKVPGCFFFVGSSPTDDTTLFPHHSSHFDINEESLLIGSSIWVQFIKDNLIHNQ